MIKVITTTTTTTTTINNDDESGGKLSYLIMLFVTSFGFINAVIAIQSFVIVALYDA